MARRGQYLPVAVTCVKKRGQCRYQVGDQFVWTWRSSDDIDCGALRAVLLIFAPLCALGAPSWERDPNVWYISCPSKEGTVWRLQALEDEEREAVPRVVEEAVAVRGPS